MTRAVRVAALGLVATLTGASPALAVGQLPVPAVPAEPAEAEATPQAKEARSPGFVPYPAHAAGWGPAAGRKRFVSRWAEDWSEARLAGDAPPFKAERLGAGAFLTLSAETRLRYDISGEVHQGLYRGVIGADLRATPNLRAFGEIGTGQSVGRPGTGANFQNDAALQQLFLDAHGHVATSLIGVMVGRQEFADGPRQLVSVADGPNLHRTWNGVRLYAHDRAVRLGAFDLRGTRLERGAFDDGIHHAERLQGLNASLHVWPGHARGLFLDPFWLHSENPAFSAWSRTGLDDRATYGVRLWGAVDAASIDWVLARQAGASLGRNVDAWGLFATQSWMPPGHGFKPRLSLRVDLASGGAAGGAGARAGFNQLYASSNYLSEGLFLSTSNLLLVAPSLSVSPTSSTQLSLEYGYARRLAEGDAAYAGLMRPYAGTEAVSGHEIGGLVRLSGAWSVTESWELGLAYEHLAAGEVLRRAGVPSGNYGYLRSTFRY